MEREREMVSHEYFEELISMYALGALADAERKQLRAHLRECSACRKQLRQEEAIVKTLPHAVTPVEPSRETKLKLFARVDADLAQHNAARVPQRVVKQTPRRLLSDSRRSAQPAFAFAVVAVLALLAIGTLLILQRPRTPDQEAIAAIINNPNVQKVSLAGTPDAPNAWGEVYMVPGHSQAVLKVGGLQALPPDKGYEFWFFKNGEPQPSDVFAVNADGTNTVLVKANGNVENFKGWGVTIEPRAGVPKPTGTIVILGGL
jgi:anti-sigma-K factor RskA